jgi:hypothetical protein
VTDWEIERRSEENDEESTRLRGKAGIAEGEPESVYRASKNGKGANMSEVVYVSKSRLERKQGPLRVANLPGEPQPVYYSVHGAIAEHYKVDPSKIKEPHSSTIDYVISATAG